MQKKKFLGMSLSRESVLEVAIPRGERKSERQRMNYMSLRKNLTLQTRKDAAKKGWHWGTHSRGVGGKGGEKRVEAPHGDHCPL